MRKKLPTTGKTFAPEQQTHGKQPADGTRITTSRAKLNESNVFFVDTVIAAAYSASSHCVWHPARFIQHFIAVVHQPSSHLILLVALTFAAQTASSLERSFPSLPLSLTACFRQVVSRQAPSLQNGTPCATVTVASCPISTFFTEYSSLFYHRPLPTDRCLVFLSLLSAGSTSFPQKLGSVPFFRPSRRPSAPF